MSVDRTPSGVLPLISKVTTALEQSGSQGCVSNRPKFPYLTSYRSLQDFGEEGCLHPTVTPVFPARAETSD